MFDVGSAAAKVLIRPNVQIVGLCRPGVPIEVFVRNYLKKRQGNFGA